MSSEIGSTRYYTDEDALTVDRAKKIHRETTASAERALKTVERTREVAGNTLDTLHSQGNKLDQIDQDLHEIDADVQQSKGILRYMRRCCLCFLCACCCDCDPDAQNDKTHKQRIAARDQARKDRRETFERADMRRADIPADARGPIDEGKARIELFGKTASSSRAGDGGRPSDPALAIGEGLADEDQQEIQQQTKKQERMLNRIGNALDDLGQMTREMGEEIRRQDPVLEDVDRHAGSTHDEIAAMTKGARRDFKIKGGR